MPHPGTGGAMMNEALVSDERISLNAPPINPLLSRNLILDERRHVLSSLYRFDILDGDSLQTLMTCREQNVSPWLRWLRMTSLNRTTPFDFAVESPAGQSVMRVRRGVPVVASRVEVLDANGDLIGSFAQKPFSMTGSFDVLDANDEPVCRLKGRAAGREFLFITPDGTDLGRIVKEWAGFKRALITGAVRYRIHIEPEVPEDPNLRQLILASAICVASVLKIDIP